MSNAASAFKNLSFAGKIVLVTGGSTGIGRATAELLTQRGAAVVIGDVNDTAGLKAVEEIQAAGGRAAYRHTDMTDEDDVEALVAFTAATFGGMDAAFNNAGIVGKHESIAAMPRTTWDDVLAVNLTGVFLCMKFELAHMLANGGGVILNTSSAAGIVGFPNSAEYVASKHGVIGLTRAAAVDFSAKGVRVNALLPGCVETELVKGAMERDPATRSAIEQGHPIGRIGLPAELAEAAAWLLSDASSFVTGACMAVDGGFSCQ